MFTGIISEVGRIKKIEQKDGSRKMEIVCSFGPETRVDESIAVNGVCLTVVGKGDDFFAVDCVDETLRKTSLGSLKKEDPVNLERSLTLQKGIEGHLVQGHVDTTGRVESVEEKGDDRFLVISYPDEYRPFIVGRGSIAVDGISMTVARMDGNHFTIAVIPHTWQHTNLRDRKTGDPVNLEFDILGKYVVRYLESRQNERKA